MSPTSIGFVFLLGILHVCSGKRVTVIQKSSSSLSVDFYFGVSRGLILGEEGKKSTGLQHTKNTAASFKLLKCWI